MKNIEFIEGGTLLVVFMHETEVECKNEDE